MVEVGIGEYFGMAEALGIIATMIVVLYFSRKQMQALSVDIETKILNDSDERIHGITQMGVEHPELIKVVSNVPSEYSSPYVPFAYHILYTFAHVFHMRQSGVVSDNEWNGWLRWMKSAFERGQTQRFLSRSGVHVESPTNSYFKLSLDIRGCDLKRTFHVKRYWQTTAFIV